MFPAITTPYATIGRKLGHSYSEKIHRHFNRYDFSLVEVDPDDVRDFIRRAPYQGITVTIPYKQIALEESDCASPEAQRIGCANTLVRQPDGSLHAFNTDYPGFLNMARHAGVDFHDAKVLILGSGGTSLTTRTVARDHGAREIVIVSRSGPVNYQNVADLHADADILINATPVGMFPNTDGLPLDLAPFPRLRAVLDVIYNPMRTRLTQLAAARGLPCGDALRMLVAQAFYAMEHFLHQKLDEAIIDETLAAIRRDTASILLVGMPGCGKTTIANALAKQLNRPCFDTDDAIIERIRMPIADFFAQRGEPAFRQIETEVIADLARQPSAIIATGGGAILSPVNRRNLRLNGFVFHLQRALSKLQLASGRPLSPDAAAVARLAQTRLPLYADAADAVIDNNASPDAAVSQLLAAFNRLAALPPVHQD